MTRNSLSISVCRKNYDALEALKRQIGTSKKFETFDAVITRLVGSRKRSRKRSRKPDSPSQVYVAQDVCSGVVFNEAVNHEAPK